MFLASTVSTAIIFLIFLLFSKVTGNSKAFSPLKLLSSAALALAAGGLVWLAKPAVGFMYPGLWLWLICVTAAAPFIAGGSSPRLPLFFPLFAVMAAAAVIWIGSGRVLRSSSYRSLMEESIVKTESLDFTDDIEPVDLKNLRVVDQELAGQRGGVLIESIQGLGSQVELGTMNIQNLNGSFDIVTGDGKSRRLSFDNELVWAGVLHPSGAFKENTTPGYIIVSAIDASRAFFVTAIDGKELEINYSTGHYFRHNLIRYLRNNGYLTKGIADFTFELSDDGRPFYIVTEYEKKVGWNAPEAVGVIAVDVQSGEINRYSIDDAPVFIDRIQPEAFITYQLNDWGKFVHGWFNSWIKQKDVLKKTEGTSLVYSGDEAYFYSGMQSAGSDRGTTGFVLVNTRTKKTSMYRISGITEDRAAEALENAKGVKEAGYYATPAILYNIGNRPVYFSTLKGADGLVKMYGFIALKNEQILGVGTTVRDALRAFETALINSSDSVSLDSSITETVLKATVKAAVSETVSGMTYYFLMLDEYPELEFFGSSDNFRELKWTKPGDVVELTYPDGEQQTVSLRSFNNLDIEIEK